MATLQHFCGTFIEEFVANFFSSIRPSFLILTNYKIYFFPTTENHVLSILLFILYLHTHLHQLRHAYLPTCQLKECHRTFIQQRQDTRIPDYQKVPLPRTQQKRRKGRRRSILRASGESLVTRRVTLYTPQESPFRRAIKAQVFIKAAMRETISRRLPMYIYLPASASMLYNPRVNSYAPRSRSRGFVGLYEPQRLWPLKESLRNSDRRGGRLIIAVSAVEIFKMLLDKSGLWGEILLVEEPQENSKIYSDVNIEDLTEIV